MHLLEVLLKIILDLDSFGTELFRLFAQMPCALASHTMTYETWRMDGA